jgi:microcystin-dependent protein
MNRVKTFDATGIAPNGRLYAGDLNLIQDAVAALTDLAQNLSAASLTVGESGLTISRFGAGQVNIAGTLRLAGLLQAISGVVPGTFTTAQRDAIASGLAQPGTILYNSTTAQLEINVGTDSARDWRRVGEVLANAITTGSIQNNSITGAKIQAGSISQSHIAADVRLVPIGAILDWPWTHTQIPTWALLPYGQQLTQAGFPALQAIADATGLIYGGSAGVNFNLPDYRGCVPAGKDDMGGTVIGRITAAVSGLNGTTLGAVGGAQGITLVTGEIPAHNHTGTTGADSPDHTHSGTTGNDSPDHTHSGSTQNDTPDHAHSGTTDGESADHAHYTSTGGVSANHQHVWYAEYSGGNWGLTQQGTPGYAGKVLIMSGSGGPGGSWYTGSENIDHTHGGWSGGRNAGHTHTFGTIGANTRHTHPFGTGGASARHAHPFTSGGRSVTHAHSIPSDGGGAQHRNVQPTIIVNKIMRVT